MGTIVTVFWENLLVTPIPLGHNNISKNEKMQAIMCINTLKPFYREKRFVCALLIYHNYIV